MKKRKRLQRKMRAFLIIIGFIFLPTTMVFQNCAPNKFVSGSSSNPSSDLSSGGREYDIPAGFPPLTPPAPSTPTSGNILRVPSLYTSIQAAVNAAQLGDTIVVEAGRTYTENIELKYKSSGSGWITIQSSRLEQLPAGKRVSPADVIYMPKIQSSSPNEAVFYTQSGTMPSHHYRLVGLEVTRRSDSSTEAYSLISLGDYGSAQNQLNKVPHHFIIDRSYIHGADGRITRRGVHADASEVEITNSYFAKFIDWSDAQAILGINTPGNHLIINNFLESTGENILYGGGDPSIQNLIPSNILIDHNHFFKPLSWKGNEPGTVKNLLELKLGNNVMIRNNILENSWEHGQRGAAFVITIRNQDGSAPWSTIRNVTIEYNLIKNANQAFGLLTGDYEHGPNGSQPMKNIFIKNNLYVGSTKGDFMTNMVNAHSGMVAENIVFDHNTFILKGGWNQFMHLIDNSFRVNGLKINNNIHTGILQGGWVSQENPDRYGTAALNDFAGSTWEFNKNVIQGPSASGANPHPSTSSYISSISSVNFINASADNYILSSSSPYKNAGTDGKDIGADVVGLNQRTACVLSGNPSLCP